MEKEPKNYQEAAMDQRWVSIMQAEIKALEKNKTWQLTTLPTNKQTIASKWIYTIKYTATGEVERFKARLVAKGYNQKQGIYFYESLSLVARTVTVRTLFSIIAMKKWEWHQIDINNAYLHGHLEEDINLEPPLGVY